MKAKQLLLILLCLTTSMGVWAQTVAEPIQYDMNFVGRGESTTVGSVLVENLTSGATRTLDGSDILRLSNIPTGIEEVEFTTTVKSVIYPNPSYGTAQLVFASRTMGSVTISITDMSGKVLVSNAFNLERGKHGAVLPGMENGIYLVSLHGPGIKESVMWISSGGASYNKSIRIEDASSVDLPIAQTPKQKAVAANNVIEMAFNAGDLLRFTGRSGNKTTIVMNQPTLSHPITFDFHTCTDAAGRHYPIVNVGGILWMAEDLGVVPTQASLRTSASAWTNYSTAKVAYRNFASTGNDRGGYYNVAGAKAALPDGWTLPTSGEVNTMFQSLGMQPIVDARTHLTTSYSNQRPNLLRGRDNSWAMPPTDPDTTSFGAMATGILSAAGVFSGDDDFKTAFWTRSTKNSQPVWWGVTETNVLLSSTQTANEQEGMRVRGCRPAPSAYEDVIQRFRNNQSAPQQAPRATQLFENGPLGGAFVVSAEKKKIFADYSYRPNTGEVNSDSRHFYNYNGSNTTYTRQKMPINGLGPSNLLRKATAIRNSNNRENLVIATWNRPLRMWNFAGATASDFIYGNGTVSLITYNDSVNGYARVDSIALPGTFTMNNHTVNQHDLELIPTSGWAIYSPFNIYLGTWEEYLSRFQVLTADFDNDGSDEMVINLDRLVVVYKKSGSTWTQLYSKTFVTHNNGNVRIAIGDANGDGTPDIGAIFEESLNLYRVDIFSEGKINQTATSSGYFTNLNDVGRGDVNFGSPFAMVDIKIGNVAGHQVNSIVAMVARKGNAPTVCLFEYDGHASLNKLTTYSSGTVQTQGQVLRSSSSMNTSMNSEPRFNDNIVLVNFDGTGSKLDVVAGLDVLSFNSGGTGFGSFVKKTTTPLVNNSAFVMPDFVTAGNYNGNEQGREQLSVMWMSIDYQWTILGSGIFQMRYLAPIFRMNVGHVVTTVNGDALVENNIGPSIPKAMGVEFYTWQNETRTRFTSESNWETSSMPMLAHARSAEGAKTLRYTGNHTVTMTEPRIQALLAAPPFWKYGSDGELLDYGSATNMGTSWGKTTTTGSGSANESSNKASAIFGFEYEFTTPIWPVKLGGIDFETKLAFEWTNSTEREFETEQSIEWMAPNNDAVILTATFYDSYEYEIIASPNPDEIGGKMVISIPENKPRTMGLNLLDYNRLAADNPECPDLRKVFSHKVGYPFTYPSDKSQVTSNVQPISSLWAMLDPAYDPTQPMSQPLWVSNDGQEYVSCGSGNSVTRSISMTQQTTTTTGFNFNLDIELVVTVAGGFKAGAGYGHGNSSSQSHSEGVGHSVAGCVPSPTYISDAPAFRWTMGWYKYRVGNQEFPVVNYVVKN